MGDLKRLWSTKSSYMADERTINIFDQAKGVVRVGYEHTKEFRFRKGVRQGCLISPLLFNTIGERVMKEVEQRVQEDRPGKIIGGRNIWNVRYADDTTILAESNE